MKPVIYRSIWRSILKNSRRNMKQFNIKKGIITTGDNINTTHYLDRYYLPYNGINTEVFGPYENRGMNALSWIKHNIRVKEPTNDNINCLFEIHTDIEEIIGLAENGIIQTDEY